YPLLDIAFLALGHPPVLLQQARVRRFGALSDLRRRRVPAVLAGAQAKGHSDEAQCLHAGCAERKPANSLRSLSTVSSKVAVERPPAALACPPPSKCAARNSFTGKLPLERRLIFTTFRCSARKADKRTPRTPSPWFTRPSVSPGT